MSYAIIRSSCNDTSHLLTRTEDVVDDHSNFVAPCSPIDSIRAVMIVLRLGEKNNHNCSVLCCVRQLCPMIRTHMLTVLKFAC